MRATSIIAIVVIIGGIAILVLGDVTGLIGGVTNDQFARIIALVAILVFVGGAAFSGNMRNDLRNIIIWVGLALLLVGGYAYRDELRPIWSRIAGELNPSRPVVSGEDVILRRGIDGHFHARTLVNGTPLDLLVDTGASRVSLTPPEAEAAGIDLSSLSYVIPVRTANGEVMMAGTTLNAVQIEGLTVNNVKAFVAPSGALSDGVLGMSFLGELSGYAVRGDDLTLSP
ncbi:TIGR02281 family clan AA aspartic protease [Tepidamorphus sp. 3E244]|uniref:retropepsin-like aspartic protease family protein n=1 Tax=Tepidamorphus sp. 3E244 TaxID=3385498 RepID=UPI0038FC4C7A